MSVSGLELALRKQRLQMAGEALRDDFSRHAAGVTPVLAVADRVIEGVNWLRQNPEVVVGGAVALIVARPRRAWRLARRSFFVWQAWNKLQRLLDRNTA